MVLTVSKSCVIDCCGYLNLFFPPVSSAQELGLYKIGGEAGVKGAMAE